ncbi:hypothetical protein SUGI_1206010 [Cryptomeria japonica]|nr:hypothetical protein SUGI_1206010 [Cryptomeria japonica]
MIKLGNCGSFKVDRDVVHMGVGFLQFHMNVKLPQFSAKCPMFERADCRLHFRFRGIGIFYWDLLMLREIILL